MAVKANTYGSVAGVQLLIGDVVPARTFTASTSPTTAQVESTLDQTAARLNNALRVHGYTAPVTSADPDALDMLVNANNCGAAAQIMAGFFPHMAYNAEGAPVDRLTFYRKVYDEALKIIESDGLSASQPSSSSPIFAGSQQDADGNTKLPIFTRNKFDYPGARSLKE